MTITADAKWILHVPFYFFPPLCPLFSCSLNFLLSSVRLTTGGPVSFSFLSAVGTWGVGVFDTLLLSPFSAMRTRRLYENSHYEHPSHEHNVDEISSCSLLFLLWLLLIQFLGSLHGRVVSMVLAPFLRPNLWVEFPLSIEWNAVFTDPSVVVDIVEFLRISYKNSRLRLRLWGVFFVGLFNLSCYIFYTWRR